MSDPRLVVLLLRDGTHPEHRKKVEAMLALKAAKVEPPQALLDYFGIYEMFEFDPTTSGLVVDPPQGCDGSGHRTEMLRRWAEEMREGYEFDVGDLPVGCTRIRVYISY